MPPNLKLDNLVYDLCVKAGIPAANIDVSDLDTFPHEIEGIHISSVVNYRQVLENLMETFVFDAFEDGKFIRFVQRENHNTVTISSDDFVMDDKAKTYEKSRVQDVELPDRTKVSFIDSSREYNVGSVDGHTVTGQSNTVKRFTTIAVLNQGYAKGLADALTHQAWVGRDSVKMQLPITYRDLKPGDLFSFSVEASPPKNYKIAEITVGGMLEVDAVAVSDRLTVLVDHYDSPGFDTTPVIFGSSRIVFAEIPLVADNAPQSNWSPRVVATQNPWPGGVDVFQDDFLGGNSFNTTIPAPSLIGELTAPLGKGKPNVWDGGNGVEIEFFDVVAGDPAGLSSGSDLAILNGSNALAVLTPSGEWEILQYVNVDLIGINQYRFSRLLRGQLGTEHYIGDPTPTGSVAFVINPLTYVFLNGTADQIGIEKTYRYGPSNKDFTDPTYGDIDITPRGVALRPYSPVQLKQRKRPNGDIDLEWIRRAKFDGDSWNAGALPIGEDFEQYSLDILDAAFGSGSVLRTITRNVTSATYTEAQQIADFGSAQTSVNWAVYQINSLVGRGTPGVGNA